MTHINDEIKETLMKIKMEDMSKQVNVKGHPEGLEGILREQREVMGDDTGEVLLPSTKYRYCNHHHELDDSYEVVDYGDGEFVANKDAIPLLKALNEVGIRTRTHNYVKGEGDGFVSILLDNVDFEVREVYEHHSSRTKYNGKKELIIKWREYE